MGGGGLRGEGCGDISPTHIYPQPPPPYPGKNGTTHRHHTTPTLTTIPGQKWNYPPPPYHPHTHEPTPRPPFFRGGEGSKKPLSTPLHHDTPLSGGASRRADRGRAAWVVAERSGASRASRMGGRGAKRSEQGKPHGWSRSGAERAGQAAWLRASGASDAHHGSAGMPPRAARLLRSLKGALRHIRRPSVPPHGSARSEAERCTSHGSAGMPPRAARLLRSLKGALRHIRRPSVPPHGSARSEAERCTYRWSCPGKKIAPN